MGIFNPTGVITRAFSDTPFRKREKVTNCVQHPKSKHVLRVEEEGRT